MKSCKAALMDSITTGKFVGLTTSAAVAACGARENGNAVAPINAISHIVWGDEAAEQETPSLKYTYTGLALNSAANISWAFFYEKIFGAAAQKGNVPVALLGGAAVSAAAYITDYHIVPPRLTPGFEKRLSPRSMLVVYTVLALSLSLSSMIRHQRNS